MCIKWCHKDFLWGPVNRSFIWISTELYQGDSTKPQRTGKLTVDHLDKLVWWGEA